MQWLLTTGVEPNPGPTLVKACLTIDSINCTSLDKHATTIHSNAADFTALQDISATPDVLQRLQSEFSLAGKQLLATTTDNNAQHLVGGVGVIAGHKGRVFTSAPVTAAFQRAVDRGRLIHIALSCTEGRYISAMVLYGFTGGAKNKAKAALTNQLVDAMRQELTAQGIQHVLLLTDLNACPDNIHSIQQLIDDGWLDVSSKADVYGSTPCEPTCLIATSKADTRRDYVFVSPPLQPAITAFSTLRSPPLAIAPHSRLRVTLQIDKLGQHVTLFRQPTDLLTTIKQRFSYLCGERDDRNPVRKQQWDTFLGLFHSRLALDFQANTDQLRSHLAAGDTDSHFALWSTTVEHAVSEFCKLGDKDSRSLTGRGTLLTYTSPVRGPTEARASTSGTMVLENLPAEPKRIQQQSTRAKQLADKVRCLARKSQTIEQAKAMARNCTFTAQAICRHSRTVGEEDSFGLPPSAEQALVEFLTELPHLYFENLAGLHDADQQQHAADLMPRFVLLLLSHQSRCDKAWTTAAQLAATERQSKAQKEKESAANNTLSSKVLFATVKQPATRTLSRIKTTRDGCTVFSTVPSEVDAAFIEEWGRIYTGNFSDSELAWRNFRCKYKDYIVFRPEFVLAPISGKDLLASLLSASPTCGSLDGWLPHELPLLNLAAAEHLAELLNAIENGAPWPQATLRGRTAPLAKEAEPATPLDYRLLSILSAVYRRWGSLRVQQLDAWTKSWAPREAYGGIQGKGAEDAWMRAALEGEYAKIKGLAYSGLVSDIYKCFDQLDRTILKYLMISAGMPSGIVTAYFSFHSKVQYRHTLNGTLGKEHSRPASVPQGCQFSMLLVALWSCPWIGTIRRTGAAPSVLADDILATATGPLQEVTLKRATEETIAFCAVVGAKLAPSKSKLFSSCRVTRQKLREQLWPGINSTIPVVASFRDLGSHFSVGPRMIGTTVNARLSASTEQVLALQWNRNLSYKDKHRVMTCKHHNSGLHGTEAAPPSQKELARYRAAVAKVSAPSSYRTSATMQFEVIDAPANLDPVVHMFQRRVCLFRRCIEKCPDNLRLIRDIILLYIKANHTGAYHAGTQLAVLQPAQPPSAKGNKAWTTEGRYGPVGLLLHQVSTCGAGLSVNLEMHQHLQVPYSICLVAYNHLPKFAQRTASLARTAAAGKARSLVKGIKEVNHPALEAALKQQTVNHGRWLRYHMSLGILTPSVLAEHIPEDTGKCRHCPHPKADLIHLLWECPALAEERYKDDPTLVMLPYKQLPPQLRIGIPPPLQIVAGNTCIPLEGDPLVHDAHPAFCDSVLPPDAHQFFSDATQAWHDGTGSIREVFSSLRGRITADNTLAINYDGPPLQGI